MQSLTQLGLEALVYLSIYLIASLVTLPVRRRIQEFENQGQALLAGLKGLAARVARPLTVLLLSELALGLSKLNVSVTSRLQEVPTRVRAWLIFWAIILFLNLIEGVARQFYLLRGRSFPIPELLVSILRTVLILAAAFGIFQSVMDIDISPLLASTALVTAVVGFALQGVLSNLLAGMSMHITRSVMPSDWVSIGDVEGKVIETNWRETRLRTNSGHVMIVPNSTVSAATIHNMTWPTPLRRHTLPVGASYADTPGDVIDALIRSAASVPEVLADPQPDAYITEFKDFGINYVLRYWTHNYHERAIIDGDVARMIWYQFKRRGIEIPFPMSDKLLNDFMAVVYNQRSMPPEDDEVARRVHDLKASDFCTRILVDGEGANMLKDEDLRQVARLVGRVLYTRGETLFRQGDEGDSCYVVVSGRVHGRVEYEDETQTVEFDVGPGALLGEMSLMTGLPRTATIFAKEEVELLEIPQNAFACLLGLHEDIPALLSRVVAERAAKNAAALERLKTMKSVDVVQTLCQENILQRFLRILGYGAKRP
jgi:small-conductance mechanosensitive channel/CRP-like cAMP-binding protein